MEVVSNNIRIFADAADDAIEKALMIIGLQAENYARNNAPVDTGRLRNSITHEVDTGDISSKVIIGSNVEYAPYQELGTNKMTATNGGKGYLRPAISDHYAEYKQIVQDVLQNG